MRTIAVEPRGKKMTEYIVPNKDLEGIGDMFGYKELIRCKNCKHLDMYTTAPKKYQHDGYCMWWARNTYLDYWCCGAERKEE
jgi:hypothetical protein